MAFPEIVHKGIDVGLRRVLALNKSLKFFSKGFGDVELVDGLLKECARDIRSGRNLSNYFEKPTITWSPRNSVRKQWPLVTRAQSTCDVRHGTFVAPMSKRVLPAGPATTAHFLHVTPRSSSERVSKTAHRANYPTVILLAPTGDHGFMRRFTSHSVPLARAGVATVLLQHPFYGFRRPPDQFRSSLLRVSDLLTMGAAMYSEINAIFSWLAENGAGPFALSGASLGAHIAAFVGTTSPFRPAIVPVAPPDTAGSAFFGVFDASIDWLALAAIEGSEQAARARVASMFELSDLCSFPPPAESQAAIIISGKYDQYCKGSGPRMAGHWGCEHREVPAGHVTGFLLMQDIHRESLLSVLKQQEELDAKFKS